MGGAFSRIADCCGDGAGGGVDASRDDAPLLGQEQIADCCGDGAGGGVDASRDDAPLLGQEQIADCCGSAASGDSAPPPRAEEDEEAVKELLIRQILQVMADIARERARSQRLQELALPVPRRHLTREEVLRLQEGWRRAVASGEARRRGTFGYSLAACRPRGIADVAGACRAPRGNAATLRQAPDVTGACRSGDVAEAPNNYQ